LRRGRRTGNLSRDAGKKESHSLHELPLPWPFVKRMKSIRAVLAFAAASSLPLGSVAGFAALVPAGADLAVANEYMTCGCFV
jgi:hypothetical protein